MSTPLPSFPGSRWWKFDFHTHTPASSDYGAGPDQPALRHLTHREWLSGFINAGIECVAITDHNCGDWIDPLKKELEAMRSGNVEGAEQLHLFPSVELTINGAHFLAIFGPEATTRNIQDLLAVSHCNNAQANAQAYCEESIVNICREVLERGGIFIPAHVDLESTGIFKLQHSLSALEPILELEGVLAMEVAGDNFTPPACYRDAKIGWASVLGSDSHHPAAPAGPVHGKRVSFPGSHWTWVKMGAPNLESLKLALHDGNSFSLKRSDACPSGFDPNIVPQCWIESLSISDARLMGLGQPALFTFNPWMNAIIGGRGSGKSTLVHFIRLATKRGGDLGAAEAQSDYRAKTTFDNFAQVGGEGRPGGLLPGTVAELIVRKGEERFRLQWQQADRGVTVSEWDEFVKDWLPADSQNVVERFPMRLFSQDEIGALSERPESLLSRVDEGIGKAEWQARRAAAENHYTELRSRIRSLQSRLSEKDRLIGQRDDLAKQLAAFESSGHAKIRLAYQKATRQKREVAALLEAFRELAAKVGALKENLLLHDFPQGLLNPSEPTDLPLLTADAKLREELAKAVQAIGKVESELRQQADLTEADLDLSVWQIAVWKAEQEHEALIAALKAEGVTDPAAYANLVSRRQILEKQLKEIESTETEITKLKEQARNSFQILIDLREDLRKSREAFLRQELEGNRYVQIQLIPFGHVDGKNQIEAEIRRDLQCQDARFANSIRSREDGKGFVEKLFAELPDDESERADALLLRIKDWKKQVFRAVRGAASNLSGHFSNHLATKFKDRPEALDRFRMWWPEDSLVVSYSRRGDGKNFVNLSSGGSAGEKAAALLAFFLADGTEPLIIDQPENDLDNHLITDLVVAQLRNIKERRQIIVVTHNPNIVVNGDAEMVHAMNFAAGQCRAKVSGALQNEAVRDEVCAVMEGGRAALQSRFERLI